MTAKVRRIIGWSLVGLLAIFIVINWKPAWVNFWFVSELEIPTSLLILLSAAMGGGAVLALQFLREFRREKTPPPAP